MRITNQGTRVSIKRRSAASVLGFLFLFVALYTVGVGFFVTINNNVQSVGQANASSSVAAQQARLEKLDVATHLSSSGALYLRINNTGGISSTITEVYVANDTKGPSQGKLISNSVASSGSHYLSSKPLDLNVSLPLTLPIGTSTKYLKLCLPTQGCDIGISKAAFTFMPGEAVVASVLTSAGNVFSAQYPPPPLESSVSTVVSSQSTLTQVKESGGGALIAIQMVASPPQTFSCAGCVILTVTVHNYANETMTGVSLFPTPPSTAVTGTASLTPFSPCVPASGYTTTIAANSFTIFLCTYSALTGRVGGFGSFSGTATGTLSGGPVTSSEVNSNPIQIGGLANVAGQGAFTGNFFILKYSSCVQNLSGSYNFYSSGLGATLVIGQVSFSKGSPNQGGSVSSNTLNDPQGVAFDSHDDLWVADYSNNRVLEYASPYGYFTSNPSEAASLVIGQASFSISLAPNPPSATSLNGPTAIAFDSSGDLWVVDSGNNRILEYVYNSLLPSGFSSGEAASLVIGQAAFNTKAAPSPSTTSLNNPRSIAFDQTGDLWASDYGNNRILEYLPSFSTNEAASLVLGQTLFTTGSASTTANGLSGPWGITFDPLGNLWVADYGNNRALQYLSPFSNGEAASVVIGQPSFVVGTANNGGLGAASLNGPSGIGFDLAGSLWVLDANNNRALEYAPPFASDEPATVAVGQSDFTHNSPSLKATGLDTAGGPPGGGLTIDSLGNLWVADSGYNRVLFYQKTLSNYLGPTCTTNVNPVTFNNLPSGSLLSGGGNFFSALYVQVTNSFNASLPILQYSYIFGENSIAGEDFIYLAGVNGTASAPSHGSWVNGVYYPRYSGSPSFDNYPNNCNIVNAKNIPTNNKCMYANPGQTVTLTYAACGYGASGWGWGSLKDADGYDSTSGCIPYSPCLVFDSQVSGAVDGKTMDCRSPVGGLPAGMTLGVVISYEYKGLIYTQVLPFQSQFLLRSSTTNLACSPGGVGLGAPTTCTATVVDTDGGRPVFPAGYVNFTQTPAGSGTFSKTSCILNAAGSCSVTFTPTMNQDATITATYSGDTAHSGSGPASQTVQVLTLVTTTVTTTLTTTLTTTATSTSQVATTTTTTTTASTQTQTTTVTSTSTGTSTTTRTTSGTGTVTSATTQTSSTTLSTSASTTTTSTSTTTTTLSKTSTSPTTVATTTLSTTLTTTTTTTSTTDTTLSTSATTSTTSTATSTATNTTTTTTTTSTTRPH